MNSPEIVFIVNISYHTDESLDPVYPTNLRTIPFKVSEVFQLVVLRGQNLTGAFRGHQDNQRLLDLFKQQSRVEHVNKVQTLQCTNPLITCTCDYSLGKRPWGFCCVL